MAVDFFQTAISVVAGVIVGFFGGSSPIVRDAYKRATTRVVARISTNPTFTSIAPTVLITEEPRISSDPESHFATLGFRRYTGFVEIDNMRGMDIVNGFELVVAMSTPAVFFVEPNLPPDGIASMVPLPETMICRGTSSCHSARVRITSIISATSRVTVAKFAVIAPAAYAEHATLYWRVIADSLPHPQRDFGNINVRFGTIETVSQELRVQAEARSAKAEL